MAINQKTLTDHYKRFFSSLLQFPDRYEQLFFVEPGNNVHDYLAYVCPLCTINGVVTTLDGKTALRGEFTKDHYPPANVGGTRFLLVCDKCNNEAGHKFENELVNLMDIQSYNNMVPGSALPVKARISTIPGNYNSQINIGTDGRFEVSFKPKENGKIPPLDGWLQKSETDSNWSAEITVKDPDEQKVSRALLKAAYLFCFDVWGYHFVYSESAALMRDVIHHNNLYPVRNPTFWLTNMVSPDLPSGVYKITEPKKWKSFIVIMKLINLETNHSDIIGVLIPGPSKTDWQRLKEIQADLIQSATMTLTFEPLANTIRNE